MFLSVAGFELRYQLRNPVFWVVAAMFFLLSFGLVSVSQVSIGSGGNIHKNAPTAIAQAHLIFTLFFMFVTTAFVANVVVRDDDTGFGPIIRATRVSKFDYLIGRFAGAYAAAALAFLSVPLALWIGSFMPWIDPETLGPNRLSTFLYSYFWLALPGIFLTSAVFFAVATATRSMMATYIGVIVFLILYTFLNVTLRNLPEYETVRGYVEPFGIGAFGLATKYWTAAERNTMIPAINAMMLVNRLIWLGVSVGILALAYRLFRFELRGSKKARRAHRLEARLAATPPPAPSGRLPDPRFDGVTARAQFWLRTRFEALQVLRSPAFAVLLVLGLLNALGGLLNTDAIFGTPLLPATRIVITILSGSFTLIPAIIAIYYAGELVWRERDRRTHEIVDASAIPDWAYVVPKALALTLVLVSTLLVATLGGILFQLAKGYTAIELGKYLLWFVLPFAIDWTLVGLLAIFVQALSPNKYVGWGVMVLYLIATMTLGNFGWSDSLYNYAATPGVPLSDMNGLGGFWVGAYWFRLYWAAFAVLLMVLAHALWRRGTETRFKPRLARLPHRLRGGAGLIAAAAVLVFAATGVWAFINTHVRNDYLTSVDLERRSAAYEKALLRFEKLPQPSITAIRMAVDLHPRQPAVTVRGRYALENRTGRPISDIHVRMGGLDTQLAALAIPGATLARDWPEFQYRIYHLATPLAPGARTTLSFETRRARTGFKDGAPDTRLVHNGTFLNNFEIAPLIGMTRQQLLSDRATRRKYGLPPELRPAKLEDLSARGQNYIHADWVTSDITLSTDADQTPIAPGDRVSDVTANGRRTARFVTSAPILNFWSVQSARYAERRLPYRGRDLVVFYDRQHDRNVDRMLNAFRSGLRYYEPAFGPYQFRYARIVEFPDYSRFAQAFAGTMPYSEGIGFIADLSDKTRIDYVTYVAAHELAHQWWAHQLIGADMQGATMLSETLAQYSALMVMEHLYGPDQIRRFLKYELDNYLRSRGGDPIGEQPLVRVENQQYIHYRKGSVVMYLLKDQLGEAKVNAALRRMLDRYRFKGAPYPRSIELVEEFRRGATPAQQALITDLFERITLYDVKASSPTVTKRPDGRFDVTMTVDARKLYADGKGVEREAPLAEPFDVGLFSAMPGRGAFAKKNVLLFETRPIRSGRQLLRFVTVTAPRFVGVDPYNKRIDRNSDDNVVAAPAP